MREPSHPLVVAGQSNVGTQWHPHHHGGQQFPTVAHSQHQGRQSHEGVHEPSLKPKSTPGGRRERSWFADGYIEDDCH
jgi:hypothetical protein